jgi:hypothetical protein
VRNVIHTYTVLAFAGLQELQWNALWLEKQNVPLASRVAGAAAYGVEPVINVLYWEIRRMDASKRSRGK